jgi:hypothetical protein
LLFYWCNRPINHGLLSSERRAHIID